MEDTTQQETAGAGPQPEPPTDSGLLNERPEIFVGAAFVGGIVLAQALRIIGR